MDPEERLSLQNRRVTKLKLSAFKQNTETK